jgi:hypothetical protein
MKRVIFIVLILFWTAILRLFNLDKVPTLFHPSSYLPRLDTVVLSLLNIYLSYKLTTYYSNKVKVGLLSAFILAVLPWTLEEGRVYSTVNNGCAILLAGIFLWQKLQTQWAKIFISLITIVAFSIFYPDIWFLRSFKLIPVLNFRDNLFRLLSPEMWFFSNTTFYHGGLREWGFIFLSLFPFFVYGLIKFFIKKAIRVFILLGIIVIVAALSPYFPESREFFLVTPFLSLIIGKGLYEFVLIKKNAYHLITFIFIFFIVYEIFQLLHFYFVHYPLNVNDSVNKIYEPF